MSSATSIEPASAAVAKDRRSAQGAAQTPDSFRPWHFFVLASLLAATAAVIMARQGRPEHLVLISLTIGAAGFAAAALYRTLAPLVSPGAMAAGEPLTATTRAVLDREKLLTLRAIKELEFDRAMGKLSEKDFDEMAGRLRARAITLMKQLDAGEGGGYRSLIEQELAARLRSRGGKPSRSLKSPRTGQRAVEPQPAAVEAAASDTRRPCDCGTANDVDAAFCKKCGARLAQGTAR